MLVIAMLYTSAFLAHLLALPLCMHAAAFIKPVSMRLPMSALHVSCRNPLPCMLSIPGVDMLHHFLIRLVTILAWSHAWNQPMLQNVLLLRRVLVVHVGTGNGTGLQ